MRWLLSIAVVALVGCSPDPDMPMWKRQQQQTNGAQYAPTADSNRVDVTRIGVFADDLAYGTRRGVYLIRDKATGREFLGISGVGISEVGRHNAGKTSVGDER